MEDWETTSNGETETDEYVFKFEEEEKFPMEEHELMRMADIRSPSAPILEEVTAEKENPDLQPKGTGRQFKRSKMDMGEKESTEEDESTDCYPHKYFCAQVNIERLEKFPYFPGWQIQKNKLMKNKLEEQVQKNKIVRKKLKKEKVKVKEERDKAEKLRIQMKNMEEELKNMRTAQEEADQRKENVKSAAEGILTLVS